MYFQAMCHAHWNSPKARSQILRSVGGSDSMKTPTFRSPASLFEMRPLNWLITSECHLNTPTSMPSARSTGKRGC